MQPILLHQYRAVRVDVTYCPQDTQKVKPDNGTAVGQSVDDAFEEGSFGEADSDLSGNTADLEERI
jgi:hypothetical protein